MGDARNLVESYLETPSAKRRQVNSSNDGGSSSIQADAILRTIALESYAHLSAEQGTNLGCAIISDLVSTDCSWSGSSKRYLVAVTLTDFLFSSSIVRYPCSQGAVQAPWT